MKLLRDDSGVSAVEYALMITLVGLVVIVAVQTLGHATSTVFCDTARAIHQFGTPFCR